MNHGTASLTKILALLTYALSLGCSICVWFVAIRSPLWLDETISFCQIHMGLSQVWQRAGLSFPAYSYTLWFFTKIMGVSEVALRIPSVFAMLGAAYLLYRAGRELFDQEIALIATTLFCIHPIVITESVDARPYAFVALVASAVIYLLARLRNCDSNWTAAWFGVMAAVIVWFHFLAGVILPALLIGFFTVKTGRSQLPEGQGRQQECPAHTSSGHNGMWRQFGVAMAAFVIAFLPVIPGLLYMFHTRGDHPVDQRPIVADLIGTLIPAYFPFIFMGVGFIALMVAAWTDKARDAGQYFQRWRIVLCASLGLVPILILFVVSRQTPLHIFVGRYRLVGLAGLELLWALVISSFRPRFLRPLFCVLVVGSIAHLYFSSPLARNHGYTWKYALESAEKNALPDRAPVLICSDLPEADHMALPVGDDAKDSNLYAQLSYYKLSVPVVPLPRTLNDEAMRLSSSFLQDAEARHQRFFAMGFVASYKTLFWIENKASAAYNARRVGIFDGVMLVEFTPK